MELPVVDEQGNAFFVQLNDDEAGLLITVDRVTYVHSVNGTYTYITSPKDLARAMASKKESGYRRITASSIVNLNAVTVEPIGKDDILLHFSPVGKRKIKTHEVTDLNKDAVISYLKDKGKL